MTHPSQYTAMAWHQSRSATKTTAPDTDGWWRPEVWYRPEFMEGDRARDAREVLEQYLTDTPVALAHIGYIIHLHARPAGRPGDRPGRTPDLESPAGRRAVRAVSAWLDEALYGQGRAHFPKEERYPLQVTADNMARADFCRMDFRALVDACLEHEVTPAPISPHGQGRSPRVPSQRMA